MWSPYQRVKRVITRETKGFRARTRPFGGGTAPARRAGSRRGRMPTPQTDAAELAQILRLVYQVLVFVRSNYLLKLFVCVLVDAVGFSSFLLPGIGELGDVGWAPLQAWFLYFMFGSVRMSGIGFMEEILPGTDFVPSASIAWACENIDVTTLDALRTLSGVVLRSHARSPRSPPRSSRPPHFL